MREEDIVALLALRTGLPAETIDRTSRLVDLVPSSFTLIELLIELQETYGFRVSQQDLPALQTVGDVLELVTSRRTR